MHSISHYGIPAGLWWISVKVSSVKRCFNTDNTGEFHSSILVSFLPLYFPSSIYNHVLSFVLFERIESAGGEHMIRIYSSCLCRAAVTSSLEPFPTTPLLHPLCRGYLEAVYDWLSKGSVLAIENILGWFRCQIVLGCLVVRRGVGGWSAGCFPSYVI